MQEKLKEVVHHTSEPDQKRVTLSFRSRTIVLNGTWNWELQSDAVYCSDVMSFPDEFEGTKGIIHPDDLAHVTKAVEVMQDMDVSGLEFRLITTYGEIKKLVGHRISLKSTEQDQQPEDAPKATKEPWEEAIQAFAARKEAALLKLHNQLNEISDKLYGTGTWFINKSTSETWYSDNVYRIHGIPPQSLNPHPNTFNAFIFYEDRVAVIEAFEKAYAEEAPLHIEYRIAQPDGAIRHVRQVTHWSFDENGHHIFSGALCDITEKEAIANSLEAVQEYTQQLEQIGQFAEKQTYTGYWIMNMVTRKVSFSDNYLRIHGVKAPFVPSHNTFLQLVHPDDQEMVEELMEQMYREHVLPETEYRIIRPDGRQRLLRLSGKLSIHRGSSLVLMGVAQDITSIKNLEQQVQDLKFGQTIQNITTDLAEQTAEISSVVWLPSGHMQWSDGLYRLLGYKPGSVEPVLRLWQKSIHPEDLKPFNEVVILAINLQPVEDLYFRMISKAGIRHFRLSFRQVSQELKQDIVVGVIQDVTTQTNLQQQAKTKERYTSLLENTSKEVLMFTNTDNTITSWNAAAEEKTGIKKSEALHANLFDIFPALNEEAYLGQLHTALAGKEAQATKVRNSYFTKPHSYQLVPFKSENGAVLGVLHIVQDMSRELEMQQQLNERISFIESMLDATVDRIVVLDQHMNYLYWNTKAEAYYATSKHRVLGKNILEVFPAFRNDPSYQEFRRALKGETVHIPANITDEREEYSETYLIPVKNEDGNVNAVLWIVHDLHHQYELTKQQQKATELVNTINGVFIEIDAGFRYRYVNARAEAYLGKPFGALSGKVIWNVFPEAVGSPAYEAIVKANTEKVKTETEFFSAAYKQWVFMSVAPLENGVLIFLYDRQDIREAQEQLQQEHRRLKEAQAIGHVGSFEWDAATDKIYWSDEMYRIHGLEPQSEEITLERVLSFIPEEQRYARTMIGLRKEAGEREVVHRLIRADGEERVVRRKLKSFTGADGVVTHLSGTVQDITEQVVAQQRLKENEALLRSTEALAGIGSYELDLATNKIRFSDGLFRLFGEEPGTIEPSLNWIDSRSHRDDIPVVRQILEQAVQNQQSYTYTRRIYHKDGSMRLLEAHGKVICDEAGNAVKFIGLVQDITERKKAEQELLQLKEELAQKATDNYKTLFNAIDEGVYRCQVIFDENNKPVDIYYLEENPAAARIIGTSFAGKTLKEINLAYEDYWINIGGEVALTGASKRMEQYSALDKKWFNFYISRVSDNNSREVVVVFQDVTERKEAEKRQQYLIKLTDSIRSIPDPGEIQYQAVCMLGEYLGAGRAFYCEVEPDGDHIWIRKDYFNEVQSQTGFFRISDFGPFLLDEYVAGRTVVMQDASSDTRLSEKERDMYTKVNIRSFVCVPLVKGGRLVSVLAVNQPTPRNWTEAELAIIEETAHRTWAAVERARAEEALRRSNEDMQLITDAMPTLIAYHDKEQRYKFVNKEFERFFGVPKEEILGKTMKEWLKPHTYERLRPGVEAALAGQRISFEDMEPNKFGPGLHSWTEENYIPRFAPDGSVEGFFVLAPDITARKRAEQQLKDLAASLEAQVQERTAALQESAAQLQKNLTILQQAEELAQMGSWEYEITTGKFSWSNGMYGLFGLNTGTQVTPETYMEFAAEEDRSAANRIIQHLHEGSQSFEETIRIKKGDAKRILKCKGSVIHDEKGNCVKMIGIDLDITEIKATEEKLKENEDLLKQTTIASPDAITIYDLNERKPVYLNNCLASWLGITNDELMAMSYEGRLQLIHPDDRNALITFNENLRKAEDNQVKTLEYRLQPKNGKQIWVRNRGKVFSRDEQCQPRYILSVLQDITREVELRQQLMERTAYAESLIDASVDRICVFDASYTVLAWNRRFEEVVGVSREAAIGKNLKELFPRLFENEVLSKAMADALEGRFVHLSPQKAVYAAGYHERFYIPLRDAEGATYAVLLILHDVSETVARQNELKHVNQILAQKNRELESKNEELSSFTFIASHDLREPLRKIHIFSNWLLENELQNLSETGKKYVSKTAATVKRLDMLIDDILTLAKVQHGSGKKQQVQLAQVVEQVKADLADQVEETGAIIETGTLPALHCYSGQLYHLLFNLVQNALKFQPKQHQPVVVIKAEPVPGTTLQHLGATETAQYLKLTVSDNGIGFNPNYAQKIFQIFQRLHGLSEYPGTGIGLAICKKIMDNHGGYIEAKSETGKGAAFHCYFPVEG